MPSSKSSLDTNAQGSAPQPVVPQRVPFVHRLYQYYQLCTSLLFTALLGRWLIIYPLAGSKFLPGGIHEFLCYLMVSSALGEIVWLFKFHKWNKAIFSRVMLKDLNFLYFVGVLHFYDDYEHALVLKNISYSCFIVGLSLNQSYCHWCKLFKRTGRKRHTLYWKVISLITLPFLYLSEFYLLLLNVNNVNFHSTPWLDLINKMVLIGYFPIALLAFKRQLSS
ncbi:Keg1p NDAI_0B06210 [Naumovozyma dairenensis CBS 421]|uniref:Very-long-chain (3R)-3-hydroxyacyl-CoA dehydratase n=1 Tax=Naumovozyma dairenensis (strain ATCC 10597 / BCRC 20456 / CBS 421 / NBRC 0211 / NRRL Y-12639) TaxID=1071378 RepID=G0W791_NAUDC|nr:hypothetical protein NDAI_0B06210 [Naumovozyma dairenensis CBS 421]CCD23652.1 hypothetical protein NDAI_0B06210 [Naumovozyma dairenensis CBS 421]